MSAKYRLQSLLSRQKKSVINLGLERVAKIYQKLIGNLDATVITIAGTNGKGSTSVFLDNIYRSGGYKVGRLNSPALLRYNEQILINGTEASAAEILSAFAHIEAVRGEIVLSYFEWLTLAALWLFKQNNLDIILLEVGLGGRLDAVNVVETDCALITNIALDHTEYLGVSRHEIALEKLGIARSEKPLICADKNPPDVLKKYARINNIPLIFVRTLYTGRVGLLGDHQKTNAALAVKTVMTLQNKHSVEIKKMTVAIADTKLNGRLQTQVVNGREFILDVAHNVASVSALRDYLQKTNKAKGAHIAVFCALKDKQIELIVDKISPVISAWHLVKLNEIRVDIDDLVRRVKSCVADDRVFLHADTSAAIVASSRGVKYGQLMPRIVVFGSFYMVSSAIKYLREK